MTIEKRLARSNIAMLAIPLITAAALAENGPEGGLRIVFTLPIAKEDAYA